VRFPWAMPCAPVAEFSWLHSGACPAHGRPADALRAVPSETLLPCRATAQALQACFGVAVLGVAQGTSGQPGPVPPTAIGPLLALAAGVDHAAKPVEALEHRHGAALGALPRYCRPEPERTLFHAVVRDRLEPFLASARDRSLTHLPDEAAAGWLGLPGAYARRTPGPRRHPGAPAAEPRAARPRSLRAQLDAPGPGRAQRGLPRKPDQSEPTGTSWILTAPDGPPGRSAPRYRVPWAELLQRVFAVDVLECPRCSGRLELIAFIAAPDVARRILDHLGLAAQAPPLAPARPPGPDEPTRDPGPDYHAADPSFDD
jgi:hypothetical protein